MSSESQANILPQREKVAADSLSDSPFSVTESAGTSKGLGSAATPKLSTPSASQLGSLGGFAGNPSSAQFFSQQKPLGMAPGGAKSSVPAPTTLNASQPQPGLLDQASNQIKAKNPVFGSASLGMPLPGLSQEQPTPGEPVSANTKVRDSQRNLQGLLAASVNQNAGQMGLVGLKTSGSLPKPIADTVSTLQELTAKMLKVATEPELEKIALSDAAARSLIGGALGAGFGATIVPGGLKARLIGALVGGGAGAGIGYGFEPGRVHTRPDDKITHETLRDHIHNDYVTAPGGLNEAIRLAQKAQKSHAGGPFDRWSPDVVDDPRLVSRPKREWPPLGTSAKHKDALGLTFMFPRGRSVFINPDGGDTPWTQKHEMTHATLGSSDTKPIIPAHRADLKRTHTIPSKWKLLGDTEIESEIPADYWNYASSPAELDPRIAAVKREYVNASGEHVKTKADAEKAIQWYQKKHGPTSAGPRNINDGDIIDVKEESLRDAIKQRMLEVVRNGIGSDVEKTAVLNIARRKRYRTPLKRMGTKLRFLEMVQGLIERRIRELYETHMGKEKKGEFCSDEQKQAPPPMTAAPKSVLSNDLGKQGAAAPMALTDDPMLSAALAKKKKKKPRSGNALGLLLGGAAAAAPLSSLAADNYGAYPVLRERLRLAPILTDADVKQHSRSGDTVVSFQEPVPFWKNRKPDPAALTSGGEWTTGTAINHAGMIQNRGKARDPVMGIEGGHFRPERFMAWANKTHPEEAKNIAGLNMEMSVSHDPIHRGINTALMTLGGKPSLEAAKTHWNNQATAARLFSEWKEKEKPVGGFTPFKDHDFQQAPSMITRSPIAEKMYNDPATRGEFKRYIDSVATAHANRPFSEVNSTLAGIQHLMVPPIGLSDSPHTPPKPTPEYKAPCDAGDFCARPGARALTQLGESFGRPQDAVIPADVATHPAFKTIGLHVPNGQDPEAVRSKVLDWVNTSHQRRIVAGLSAAAVTGVGVYGLTRLVYSMLNRQPPKKKKLAAGVDPAMYPELAKAAGMATVAPSTPPNVLTQLQAGVEGMQAPQAAQNYSWTGPAAQAENPLAGTRNTLGPSLMKPMVGGGRGLGSLCQGPGSPGWSPAGGGSGGGVHIASDMWSLKQAGTPEQQAERDAAWQLLTSPNEQRYSYAPVERSWDPELQQFGGNTWKWRDADLGALPASTTDEMRSILKERKLLHGKATDAGNSINSRLSMLPMREQQLEEAKRRITEANTLNSNQYKQFKRERDALEATRTGLESDVTNTKYRLDRTNAHLQQELNTPFYQRPSFYGGLALGAAPLAGYAAYNWLTKPKKKKQAADMWMLKEGWQPDADELLASNPSTIKTPDPYSWHNTYLPPGLEPANVQKAVDFSSKAGLPKLTPLGSKQ